MRPEDEDLIRIIKDIQRRLRMLEVGKLITELTIPSTGKIVVPVVTADPASGENGQIIYNSTARVFKGYSNGSWVALS